MHPSDISLDKLQLGDVSQNGRGGKTASLSVNGKPLRLTVRNCTTPFEVSSYDRVSDRKSLELRADDETAATTGTPLPTTAEARPTIPKGTARKGGRTAKAGTVKE